MSDRAKNEQNYTLKVNEKHSSTKKDQKSGPAANLSSSSISYPTGCKEEVKERFVDSELAYIKPKVTGIIPNHQSSNSLEGSTINSTFRDVAKVKSHLVNATPLQAVNVGR